MPHIKLHHQTEVYKSGWTHGFYDCRNDEGDRCVVPVEIPPDVDRERWVSEYWRGFFAGKAAAAGYLPGKPPAMAPPEPVASSPLTIQVLREFAAGASIDGIAAGLNLSPARVEGRLHGAVAAILRFLIGQPGAFLRQSDCTFERELLALARSFMLGAEHNRRRAA